MRRSWWVFVGLIVVGAVLGYVISDSGEKQYRASSVLNFQQNSFDSEILGNSFVAANQDPTQALATQQGLVSLPSVAQEASALLHGAVDPAGVASAILVNDVNGSNLETITATAASPALSARLANAYAQGYVKVAQRQARLALTGAAASLTAQIHQAQQPGGSVSTLPQLQTLLDRVKTVSALQTGGAQVVDVAGVPTSAFSPRPKRDAVFGAILGLVLALILVGASRQVDRKVRDIETLEHLASDLSIGHGLLGTVQRDDSVRGRYRLDETSSTVAEAFGLLQARLRYLDVEGPHQVMMLVSASAAEGKSTVAFYLAATAARSGARVLLIECDLRQPQLAQRLTQPVPEYGLAEYLSRPARPLDDVITSVIDSDTSGDDRGGSLDVLPAGGSPPNPAELLASARMTSLLEEARSRWDLIVLDTPPIELVPDGISLLPRVDGILIVARIGKATRDSLRRVNRDLVRTGSRVLGIVANMTRSRRSDRYGGYGYGYEAGARSRWQRNGANGKASSGRETSATQPLDRTKV